MFFFDEVSMLSACDLYRINAQLANMFGVSDIPFGGLNMVFQVTLLSYRLQCQWEGSMSRFIQDRLVLLPLIRNPRKRP
jgi:hypothetical protein